MDREEALKILAGAMEEQFLPTACRIAIKTLLVPPVWYSLQERPLTKEDVGKWAWIVNGLNCTDPKMVTLYGGKVGFRTLSHLRDVTYQFIGDGFPPPAPKKEGE